jgi:predicted DNA-binding ribbon-helix-helix protein
METVKTTITLEKQSLQAIKQIALNKKTTQTEIIKEYIKQGLKNEEKEIKSIKKYDCDLLLKRLEELDEEMDKGNKVTLNVE